MPGNSKTLKDLAQRDPDGFEKYYLKNVDSKADGATIAGKQKYWKNVDLSTVSESTGSSSSGGGSTNSDFNIFDFINNKVKAVGKISGDLLESQYGKTENQNAPGMITTAIADAGLNPSKLFSSLAKQSGEAIIGQLKQESELLSNINSEVGISGELSEGLRKDMIAASIEASKYGVTLKEIGELYTGLSEKSGKFALINKPLIDEAVPVATALGKTMSQLSETINEFEKVGLGADKTIKQIGSTATASIGLGLNAKKIATDIQTNIGLLNSYGFENGYKGLERMVQKAAEFRMEMGSVTTIAEKVFSPEGAIELSANLQVLGGAIGDFNDPIRLMYDATNNVNGLQDALIGAAQGLATYNQEQGRFEITPLNLRKAKEMANAFGIIMGELTKISIAAAERTSATTALLANSVTSNLNDKDKEFLLNMSRMEGGEMKIVVPESLQEKFGKTTEIALDSITKEQKDALVQYQQKLASMDPKAIALSQLTETQQLVRGMDVVTSYIRVRLTAMGKGAIEGAAGEKLKEANAKLTAYAGSLDTKKAETDQKTVMAKIEELIKNPGSATKLLEDLYNKITNTKSKEETEKTQPTTQNVNMTITHKSEGPITDTVFSAVRKDPTSMAMFASTSPKDLTSPNTAHKK